MYTLKLLFLLFASLSVNCFGQDLVQKNEPWDSLMDTFWVNIKNQVQYEDQISLCEKMMRLAVQNKDIEQQLNTNDLFCQTYKRFGMDHLSFAMALKLEDKYTEDQKTQHPRHYANFLKILADGYNRIDSLSLGLRFLQNANALDSNIVPGLRYDIALAYIEVGKPDSGLWTMDETISEYSNPIQLIQLYNMRGLCQRKIGNYEHAIIDFKSSIEYIDQTGARAQLKPVLYGNIGACYKMLGEYSSAYEYLTYDAQENKQLGNFISASSAELALAEIDTTRKEYRKAILRYEDILNMDKHHPLIIATEEAHLNLSILYKKIGDSAKSKEHEILYNEFIQSSELKKVAQQKNIENEITVANFETTLNNVILEKENIENNLLIERTQRTYESAQSNYYLLIGILVLIVAILIFSRFRTRIKRSLELTAVREQIAARNAELAEKNNELLKLQISESEVFVNQIRYELTLKSSFSKRLMEFIRKNDFDIEAQDLRSVKMFIDNELGHKSILMDYSEDINLNFVTKLLSTYPNITETELSLISLIIQNYSNKEIAVSRSMTIGSVKVAKNRIKKKLSLTAKDDLKVFLEKLILVESKRL